MKNKIWGHLFVFWCWTRLEKVWSTIYRFIFHRKYKGWEKSIPKLKDLEEVQFLLDQITWKADGWKELKHSVGSPSWAGYVLQKVCFDDEKQPEGAFDCDDFSVLAANMLKDSSFVKLVTVFYRKFDGSLGAHMVCAVYKLPEESSSDFSVAGCWYHLGNWGLSEPMVYFRDLINDIVEGKTLIAYAVYDSDLRLEAARRTLYEIF